MPQPIKKDDLSPFAFTVQEALKMFRDPEELGRSSILATPSFLSSYLRRAARQQISSEPSTRQRGLALRELLRDSLEELKDEYEGRYYKIIQLRYFEGKSVAATAQELNLGKGIIHRNQKSAFEALGRVLVNRLKPAIQLESPPRVQHAIVGRDEERLVALKALTVQGAITLVGSGGVGKTSLGSQIAAEWDGPVFWFTVRLGINDSLTALVFSLGNFLHQHGESALWGDLLADPSRLRVHQVLEMLAHGFKTLAERNLKPLLSIDEVDQLTPTKNGEHAQVVQILDGLRGVAPILLIGQQALLDSTPFCALDSFTIDQTGQLMKDTHIELTEDELAQLQKYTQGVPRILMLFLVLYEPPRSVNEIFQEMDSSPPLEYMMSRIFQRLSLEERQLLSLYSIFREPVSTTPSINAEYAQAFGSLLAWRLIQEDAEGRVSILPAYREVIYHCLPHQSRIDMHLQAVQIYSSQSMITAAAQHLILAELPEQAIWLWREHQQSEISQGQAAAALGLLRTASTMSVGIHAREAVAVLIGQLERITGNTTQALEDIHSILFSTPVFELESKLLDGVIANDMSEFDDARRLHEEAIGLAESIVESRLALAHKGLAWMYKQEGQLELAWEEALLARYEAENVQGTIETERCNYDAANRHYQSAYQLANELDYLDGLARTSNNMARLAAQVGDFQRAIELREESDGYFQKIGKLTSLFSTQINWAFIYYLADEHHKAIESLQKGLDLFQEHGKAIPPRQAALIDQAMAESYLELDNLIAAEAHVRRVIEMEEPSLLASAYRTFGELLLKQGNFKGAEEFVRQSIALCEQSGDLFLAGYAWRAMIGIQRALDNENDAQVAKTNAIDFFEQINLRNEVEKTLQY